jgi:putative membrane protein
MKLITVLGVACLLTACGSNGDDTSAHRDRTSGTPARTDTYPKGGNTNNVESMPSADVRILSILHAKNLEEIQIGQLAQQKGTSDDVRSFGETLVRNHTESDTMVRNTAQSANLLLLEPRDISESLAREKGMTSAPPDPMAELRDLEGAAFDRTFAQKMLAGHRELIQIVENARPNVKNSSVRDLLDRTLPTLRQHEQMAAQLANR